MTCCRSGGDYVVPVVEHHASGNKTNVPGDSHAHPHHVKDVVGNIPIADAYVDKNGEKTLETDAHASVDCNDVDK